ncbi:MAG TPA: sugar phosphate isomerase/epimerase [Bryobacteraceae bacterium]|jgi:inosose dehydratase|nr:sugar phosphate isomerase/epimerase [Bryobacteraceae bacterium]
MTRRRVLQSFATALTAAAADVPANQNIRWALSLALWRYFPPVPFTDILDVMKDTGFIGIRMVSFPASLEQYKLTLPDLQRELSKRGLYVATISFGGPSHDPSQREKVLSDARAAMEFLKQMGANRLTVFPPSPKGLSPEERTQALAITCETFNKIGALANEMGFAAGVHNHLNSLVEKPEEIDRCMALTDPDLFHFCPDTAHILLGGGDPVEKFRRYKSRIVFADYKDARWTTPGTDLQFANGRTLPKDSADARFFSSIYDLGMGDVNFPALHRILKSMEYKGWLCVDLDRARHGPRASYEACGKYIIDRLQPIYI